MLVQHGIARRAREDRCSPRHVVRGTVPMTAHLCGRRRIGVRVVATRAPKVLETPTGDSVEPPACGGSDALETPAYRSAACVASAVRGGGVRCS